MNPIYENIRQEVIKLCKSQNLMAQPVRVRAHALSTEEAIGHPEADDFPLQKGKEKLMQAHFLDAAGQAFTDRYGDFDGVLKNVLHLKLENNFQRAVFVATINAVLRHMKQIAKTIHCHDRGPNECAGELVRYLESTHGSPKVAQIGFQPRMVEALAANFPLRVLDLDPDNIGARKFQITVEGPGNVKDVIDWADLLLVTGTTLVNGTIGDFLGQKPILFYGTTIAGTAHLMKWDWFCHRST